MLAGGLGVLPLAPMTAMTPEDVPPIVEELKRHVDPAGTTHEEADFWVFTALLTGLRFEWHQIEDSFQGITAMRHSSAYEQFVAEGRAQGLKEGRKKA